MAVTVAVAAEPAAEAAEQEDDEDDEKDQTDRHGVLLPGLRLGSAGWVRDTGNAGHARTFRRFNPAGPKDRRILGRDRQLGGRKGAAHDRDRHAVRHGLRGFDASIELLGERLDDAGTKT